MKRFADGMINDAISIAGNMGYPGYVVQGSHTAIMIDAGINLYGPAYMDSLAALLGAPEALDLLCITHSHYDHLGAAGYLKRNIPSLAIGGHERIESLTAKQSVLDMMNSLSEIQRPLFAQLAGDADVTIEPIRLDQKFKQGDRIDLGGRTLMVYETPGHTRDSLSYFIPEIAALFCGEAAGVPLGSDADAIQVEFLSSYTDYIKSIHVLIGLKPRIICTGHVWVMDGDDAARYLYRSLDATREYRMLIERYLHNAHGDVETALAAMVRIEYDEQGTIYQERTAYITNTRAQIRLIADLQSRGLA